MNLDSLDFVTFLQGDYKQNITKEINFGCRGARSSKINGNFFVHQSVREVCDLMDFFKDKKIDSYLEVGVEEGGMLILMDSFFRSINIEYKGSAGVDIQFLDTLKERLSHYCQKYNLKFHHQDCFTFIPESKVDFIFIDNNLRGDNMKKCFDYYLPYANKYIGFHDILDPKYGAKKLFSQLKQQHKTFEFVHSGAGIGIIELT